MDSKYTFLAVREVYSSIPCPVLADTREFKYLKVSRALHNAADKTGTTNLNHY